MITGRNRDVLASNTDRDQAASLLRRHHEEGRLSSDELKKRLAVVRSAETLGALTSVSAGLPTLAFEKGDAAEHKLASDGDRDKAKTKLRQHREEGRIGQDEFDDRTSRAGLAKTQAELDLLFKDLPSLGPAGAARIPGNQYKRADDEQRNAATAELRRHKDAGRLTQAEFDARAVRASTAETPAVLKELLSDLPSLGPGGVVLPVLGGRNAKVRASDDDRNDGVRKLKMHADQGHFANDANDECARRMALVQAATTPHEIEAVFSDLPALAPTRPPWRDKRISDGDRNTAIRQLTDHLAKGRIDVDEHRIRVDQVRGAREREELNAAFRGLPRPGTTAVIDRTTVVIDRAGDVAGEGVRRAKEATKWVVLAGASFFIGLVLLSVSVRAAAAVVIVSILLMVMAARSLARGKARHPDDRRAAP
jgi:hypothetical protein